MPVRDVILALCVALIWGTNFVAIRVGLDAFAPLAFSALRFVAAAFPAVLLLPRPACDWKPLIACGLLLGVAQFACLFVGMQLGVSPGLASLVLQLQAFFTALLAWGLHGARPHGHQWLGMAVAFVGVTLIAVQGGTDATPVGLALVVFAALGWAGGNLALKRVGSVDMLAFVVWMSLVPPLPLAGLSLVLEGVGAWAAIGSAPLPGWLALGYIAFASTLVGYALWGGLMQRHPVTLVAPFSLLVPVAGMAASSLLLDEAFTPMKLAAAALVMAGLVVNVFGARLLAAVRLRLALD